MIHIERHPAVFDRVPKVGIADGIFKDQNHGTPENTFQAFLQSEIPGEHLPRTPVQARHDIHIAFRVKIRPRDGTEHIQTLYALFLADRRDFFT